MAEEQPQNAPASTVVGAANINITPRRVIFDRAKRSDAVYVFNQGNAPVTVDVSLVDNVMLTDGQIVPSAIAAERGAEASAAVAKLQSAKPLVIAAPSRLQLLPGQGKTVRLRADLGVAGAGMEYRTHLTVTAVPPADTGLTAEQAAATQRGELVFRIQSIFGISIPLIVRNGAEPATASFGAMQAAVANGAQFLDLTLRRQGASSLYGNLEVRTSGRNGELLGIVKGLGVYPEVDERKIRVPLSRALRGGEKVEVSYIADDARSAPPLASGSFTAP